MIKRHRLVMDITHTNRKKVNKVKTILIVRDLFHCSLVMAKRITEDYLNGRCSISYTTNINISLNAYSVQLQQLGNIVVVELGER